MFFFALTLACTGRPSSVPEPAAEPVVEAPAEEVEEAPAEVEEAPTEVDGEADREPASGEVAVAEAPQADGASCLSGADCASGICEGLGCGEESPGVCMPQMRPCTRDLRPYCGCDGETFRTSGSCPGKRYASKDACPGDPGLGLPLTPP